MKTLSDLFTAHVENEDNASVDVLEQLLQEDLSQYYPALHGYAKQVADRGTQRICVWGEKVTAILHSLLMRYRQDQGAFLKNTSVWVCSVCGFVFVGDEAPELCPVCKVPAWKFEKNRGEGGWMKYVAVRNIRLCTKDCLCLYVCPVGATDTEDSIIDVKNVLDVVIVPKHGPSGAISLVPLTYPPQQSKDLSLVHLSHTLTKQKAKQEQLARQLMNSHNDELYRLMKAFVKSIRLVHEDIMREAGFMLPQSANTQQLLESFVENPPCDGISNGCCSKLINKDIIS